MRIPCSPTSALKGVVVALVWVLVFTVAVSLFLINTEETYDPPGTKDKCFTPTALAMQPMDNVVYCPNSWIVSSVDFQTLSLTVNNLYTGYFLAERVDEKPTVGGGNTFSSGNWSFVWSGVKERFDKDNGKTWYYNFNNGSYIDIDIYNLNSTVVVHVAPHTDDFETHTVEPTAHTRIHYDFEIDDLYRVEIKSEMPTSIWVDQTIYQTYYGDSFPPYAPPNEEFMGLRFEDLPPDYPYAKHLEPAEKRLERAGAVNITTTCDMAEHCCEIANCTIPIDRGSSQCVNMYFTSNPLVYPKNWSPDYSGFCVNVLQEGRDYMWMGIMAGILAVGIVVLTACHTGLYLATSKPPPPSSIPRVPPQSPSKGKAASGSAPIVFRSDSEWDE